MRIECIARPLTWPPATSEFMQELCHDWNGEPVEPPARYGLVEDPGHLWLVASREAPAKPHPMGDCGDFLPELWKHDVAELFIASPDFQSYLEFNLSPRGAWWAAGFCGPRQPWPLDDLPPVITHGSEDASAGWQAALGIPLGWLRETIAWGPESPLNACFILDSPEERFLSACDLGGGKPDYHRPQAFRVAARH